LILITAPTGQLGRELTQALSPLGPLILWDRKVCDLSSTKILEKRLAEFNPEGLWAIVNAAAYTKVDLAETENNEAMSINQNAAALLAQKARELKALFIHYSTDYVYDGTKDGYYVEEDACSPLNHYGFTKYQGDLEVVKSNANYLILRTSWVYGLMGQNFPRTVLKLAKTKTSLDMDATQLGAPTSTSFLAATTLLLLDRYKNRGIFPSPGIYHLTLGGETTWYEFSHFLVSRGQELGIKGLTLDPENILPRYTPQDRRAKRPLNSRLSTKKIQEATGIIPPHWKEEAEKFIKNYALLETLYS
jgi:dTDP-4-dehydrorhamnose reductase